MEQKPETRSLKPPKEWFDKKAAEVKAGNPDYSEEQVSATVGKIWYELMNTRQRREKRHAEGKQYGEALKKSKIKFDALQPAKIGEGWTDPAIQALAEQYSRLLKQNLSPEIAFGRLTGQSRDSRYMYNSLPSGAPDSSILRQRGDRAEDFCIACALRGLPMPAVEFADDKEWRIDEYSDEVIAALLKAATTISHKINVENLEERVGEDLDGDGEAGEDEEHKKLVLGEAK